MIFFNYDCIASLRDYLCELESLYSLLMYDARRWMISRLMNRPTIFAVGTVFFSMLPGGCHLGLLSSVNMIYEKICICKSSSFGKLLMQN